jgi:hypothetical protein
MIKKLSVVSFFLLFSILSYAAELKLQGFYTGANLYVENPSAGKGFCVTKVMVNDVLTTDEINSNAFEIDFSRLNIAVGTAVNTVITHRDDCTPIVVNPRVLQKTDKAVFTMAKIDKNMNLTWSVTGKLPDRTFYVEQFRWNKWIGVAEMPLKDSVNPAIFSYEVTMHSGNNQFRIYYKDADGEPVYSKTVKYLSKKPELTVENLKVSDKLILNGETLYEVLDEKGNLVQDGFTKDIDVSKLEKGKYWLNFDNKTVQFLKK